MPSRILPGIGLTAGYSSGEDGWGSAMNTNMILLSALCQLCVENIVDTLSPTAADGEIFLLSAVAPSNPGMIAIRDDGVWRYVQPVTGWEAFSRNNNTRYRYLSGAWVGVASAATIPAFSEATANYILTVNAMGSGVIWSPPYTPTYEIPLFTTSNIGQQLEVIADSDPESIGARLAWQNKPLALPAIPANSAGKVAVVNPANNGLAYEEDGKYKAVSPGYVVTDEDMSGRVILGATGNIVIPAGLTRTSTLTICRMSTNEVVIEAGAGVTLNVADNRFNLRARYSAVSVVRTGLNQYVMFGDVALA